MSSSSSRTHPQTSGSKRSAPTNDSSAGSPLNPPALVPASNADSNNNSLVVSQASTNVPNTNVPPIGQAIIGLSNLNIDSVPKALSAQSPPVLPMDSTPSPAKKVRVLIPPPSFDGSRFGAAPPAPAQLAPVVPNGAIQDLILDLPHPQLVLRDTPEDVTADMIEAHLRSENLAFRSVTVRTLPAGKAIISCNCYVEHHAMQRHNFPWGKICPKTIEDPYRDNDVSLRIAVSIPVNILTNPLRCIAGAFAALGAWVEGGSWSPTNESIFNVYVESLDCAKIIFRFQGSLVFPSDAIPGRDCTVLLKRHRCSLVASNVAKVFVGSIKNLTDVEVERKLIDVLDASPFTANKFLFFAANRPKDGKTSNYGFAYVEGTQAARALIEGGRYEGKFVVDDIKKSPKK